MSFYVHHDGRTWRVHTEVGNGPARIVFDELVQSKEEQPLEPSEEPAHA